jgi:hypothetical protein
MLLSLGFDQSYLEIFFHRKRISLSGKQFEVVEEIPNGPQTFQQETQNEPGRRRKG